MRPEYRKVYMTQLVQVEAVTEKILNIRGKRVMLARDLAMLYGVTTGNLNKAVKRNIELYKRNKFESSEIRRRILKGEDWSELVPPDVHRIVLEIDGENSTRDLAKYDSVNHANDSHGIP